MKTISRVIRIAIIVTIIGSAFSTRVVPREALAGGPTLVIKVTGARNAKGRIGIAVFRGEAGFPGDTSKALRVQQAEIDSKTLRAQVTLEDIPQGEYAVTVFHDENMNGKLDKNILGIPKEGYGASNNPAKKTHAPTFDEAKFTLGGTEQTVEIKLMY